MKTQKAASAKKVSTAKKPAPKASVKKVAEKPQPQLSKDSSVSVRKIENGHIVTESGTTGSGRNQKWTSREYFSAVNPVKIAPSGTVKQPKFGKR